MAYDLYAFLLVVATECPSSSEPPVSPEGEAFRSDVSSPEISSVIWVWVRPGTASERRIFVLELVSSVKVIAIFGRPLYDLAFPGCHGSDRDRAGLANSSGRTKSPNLKNRKREVLPAFWRM